MQKVRIPINSFQYGEISESTLMRTDSQVYTASAQRIENLLVTVEGAVKRRPSLKHIYSYTDLTYEGEGVGKSHMFPFIFSDDEKYIISIENGQVRCFFLDDAGVYGDAGEVVLVETITQDTDSNPLPFDVDYLREYTTAQSGDVMFICHPLFMPRMLIRTGLDSFEITPFAFDQRADGLVTYQPYSSFHSQGVTLNPSAVSGTVTVVASDAYFTPNHVGTIIRYDESEMLVTTYVNPTEVEADVIDRLKIRLETLNPLRTNSGSSTVEVTHISHGFSGGERIVIIDAAAVGGINTGNLNGTRTVSSVIDENTFTFTAGGSASSSEDGGGYVKIETHAPTTKWSEQCFSAVRGYPAAVTFHENRLIFGGTIYQPDTLWMSKSGQFFNFDVGEANDNDSIDLTASTGDVNTIRYLISNRDLQIFTDSAELYVPTYLNQAITPTNAQVRKQTPYGVGFTVPQPFDGATLYIQNGGSVVREFLYTDTENAYSSTAISNIASHLVYQPRCFAVVKGAFNTAESYAALSNGDGNIALFSSSRAEKRAAWTRITTDGSFCSVIGIQERLFANVWGSNQTMHLLEFTGDIGLDRWIFAADVAGYVDVSSSFVTNEVVGVFGWDNAAKTKTYLGQFTVGASGVDVSGYSYDKYYVGYEFDVAVTTNPIDANMGTGPATGSIRGIVNVVADLRNTESVNVNNRPLVVDAPFSGKKQFNVLGYNRDPQVTITQDEPLPIQVNGLIVEIVV